MEKYLIKSTNEVRLETKEDIDAFRKELEEKADKNFYVLTNFAWTEKTVKSKGEVIEIYYQVKYTLTFNDLKAPDRSYSEINYV